MALCDSHSGSHWLLLALSGFQWLSLALTGSLPVSLWLSLALLWLPLWLSLALTATLWHTLALSGSLLLSYTVLDRPSGPLLGSQRRCHADALSPALLQTGACHSFDRYILYFFVNLLNMFCSLANICAMGCHVVMVVVGPAGRTAHVWCVQCNLHTAQQK